MEQSPEEVGAPDVLYILLDPFCSTRNVNEFLSEAMNPHDQFQQAAKFFLTAGMAVAESLELAFAVTFGLLVAELTEDRAVGLLAATVVHTTYKISLDALLTRMFANYQD